MADLRAPFGHNLSPLGPESTNRCAKECPQDRSGRRCQKRCKVKPSKPFEIVLPCKREHSFQCDAMCRKGCLNNTLLSSLWTPVLPQGSHFGSHGPSCTGHVFWYETGTHEIGLRGGRPAMGGRIVTNAPAVAPWIYKDILVYIYIYIVVTGG